MKPAPPDFSGTFQKAIADWRKRHAIRDDDVILLCLELFQIHQKHWDEIRHRDLPSFNSAESFPRIAVFSHEGRLFTNCGVHFCGAVHAEADCYPLIPADEYRGPEQRQYTYQGREAAYRGEVFRLGPKVVFKTSDPTVEEWRRLLRVHYADGGMFAARCTYLEFLGQRFAPNSENEESARQKDSLNAACGECHALRRKWVGCWRRKATLRTRRCNPKRRTSRYDHAEQNCPARDR